MNMKYRNACWLMLLILAFGVLQAAAQPYVISTLPAMGAFGVPPSNPVVFTFSEAMNPAATSVTFSDPSNPLGGPLPTTAAWSSGNKVLTCTPNPAFPANIMILWSVDGESAEGDPTSGTDFGFFTTASGGGGGSGSGTNATTTFTIGTFHYYNQTETTPAIDPELSYAFMAGTELASNRTATAISVTLPTGSISNLNENPIATEVWNMFAYDTSLAAFNDTFRSGNYTFFTQATTSNQTVIVNFPASMDQPNAPRITNLAAAQTVSATQPFTLSWEAFQGGTATDFIQLEVEDIFSTVSYPSPGSLSGTATAVTIPANTLQENFAYDAYLTFYRFVTNQPSPSYGTVAFRATTTRFTLVTSGNSATPPSLANPAVTGNQFRFDIPGTSINQDLTVLYSTNLASGTWYALLTTNSPGGTVRITDPRPITAQPTFYRVRAGG